MTRVSARLRELCRGEGGFTLIEMLTALSILLIVFGTMTVLMVSATTSEVDLTRRVQAQQQGRLALEAIRHQVHEACTASHVVLDAIPVPASGSPHSNINLALPNPDCTTTTAVTWCTSGSGSRWTLRQIAGTPASCAFGRAEADYITLTNVFTLEPASTSLAALSVNFPIDLDPLSAVGGTYRLEDRLVMRNSTRTP